MDRLQSLSFAAVVAPGLPIAADEDVDLVALVLGGGLELGEVAVGEGLELGRVFAGDDDGLGVDAGGHVVQAGAGLAFGGAGAGGFLRVLAVGLGLTCRLPWGYSFRGGIKKAPRAGSGTVGLGAL